MSLRTIVIAQGGGPTVVINQSLAAIISAAKDAGVNTILGAAHGIAGLAAGDFHDLGRLSLESCQRLANTPGAGLGSSRDKPDQAYCDRIMKMLEKHAVDALFYIGGNDSSSTLHILAQARDQVEASAPVCVHVPKTIDNDLVHNDHTPGYPSAALWVAAAFAGIDADQRSLHGVHIGVAMGRHSGFLTAAAGFGRRDDDSGPHIICLPEVPFDSDAFLAQVETVMKRHNRCLIAVSEGITSAKGKSINAISDASERDQHGNVQLSGTSALGNNLKSLIEENLSIKRVRADTFGYAQRSFPLAVSTTDRRHAYQVGITAFTLASQGQDGSVTINRQDQDFVFGHQPLDAIAAKTRLLPNDQRGLDPFTIDPSFNRWLEPLIGDGWPDFFYLQR